MNRNRNVECQDRTYYVQHDDFLCIALADGASCTEYGRIGAQTAAETVCEFMKNKFDYLFELEDEKIKYDVLCEVLRNLRKIIIEDDIKLKELGSTLLFTALKDNRYISMLLGDGAIIKRQKDSYEYLIYSESISTNKKKYLTSSPMCYLNAYVKKGRVNDIKSFIMCSDGFLDNLNIKHMEEGEQSIENLIYNNFCCYEDNEIISGRTKGSINMDDSSCIFMYKNYNG